MMVYAEDTGDIGATIELADEFKIRAVIVGGTEAYLCAAELAERHIPVTLNPPSSYYLSAGRSDHRRLMTSPIMKRLLVDAGVTIALTTAETERNAVIIPEGDPFEVAALAYRQGLSDEAVLEALTVSPAKILGIQDRVGTLEKGKDADIVILRGHPLRTRSEPELVFIDGKVVSQWVDRSH
jgi:imidazolonepropionase-like amidohydrolase